MQNAVAGFAVATIQARAVNKSLVRFIVIGFSINDDVTSPKGKSTPGEPHHRLSSSALDRFTLTRSCEPYVRIICTSEPTRLTRTLAVFPAAAV